MKTSLFLSSWLLLPTLTNAFTFIVSNSADQGIGSLHEAILDANYSFGPDEIRFEIPGTGVQTIFLSTPLPALTEEVLIDGWSQGGDGYTGPPLIALDGTFTMPTTSGLSIRADSCTVRGLAIINFPANGIEVITGDGNVIAGNCIGLDPIIFGFAGNGWDGVFITTSNTIVGGSSPELRNIISGNVLDGVEIAGWDPYIYTNDRVIGNFIGTDNTGTGRRANRQNGVHVSTGFNFIGGPTSEEGNLISGNYGAGVLIDGGPGCNVEGNVIQGNLIGTDITGRYALPNIVGVRLGYGAWGTLVGADIPYQPPGNVIAFNETFGIWAGPCSPAAFLGNSIFANGSLGISWSGGTTATPNDPGDTDPFQNYPVLSKAWAGSSTGIKGVLDSKRNQTYRLEFFVNAGCDASGFGEGARGPFPVYVTTDGAGTANFDVSIPVATSPNAVITATATDPGANNTSEFSACVRTRQPLMLRFQHPTPQQFVLIWPFEAGEATVEATTDFVDWAPVLDTPVRIGDSFYVTNYLWEGDSRFFRLRQP
jgi:hypothetical protein